MTTQSENLKLRGATAESASFRSTRVGIADGRKS
jgi:hypothetical protein